MHDNIYFFWETFQRQKDGAWPLGRDRGAVLRPSTMFCATYYSKSIFFPLEQLLHCVESTETYKAL